LCVSFPENRKDIGAYDVSVVEPAVSLAREEPFLLGRLTVRPGSRELVASDGRREVLEPRVMQVLVALWRADGAILTRDDLLRSCWDGRIVGEDAINRVMSRLRRVVADHAEGGFRIETITKVGYRLVRGEAPSPVLCEPRRAPAEAPAAPALSSRRASRRTLLVGAVAAGGAALGGAVWLRRRPLDPQTQRLYDQGWTALDNTMPEQAAQAVGLFQAVVARAPNYADGWGALANAYRCTGRTDDPAQAGQVERGRSAARRALQLDPDNALALAALSSLDGVYGRWSQAEAAARKALARHPRSEPLLGELKWLLSSVGRTREAAEISDQVEALGLPPSPRLAYLRVEELDAAGRLEEADLASNQMIALFPRNTPVWFTHFYHLMRGGRPAAALAFGMDAASRPPGVPEEDFARTMAAAKAVLTRAPADIDEAFRQNMSAARKAAGYAENALLLAAQLGRLDEAFAVAEAYYFGRGFSPPSLSFSTMQRQYYRERRTHFLFWPPTTGMRADPRFGRMAQEMGLLAYWRASGRNPD
jgi:DNA-binding winged helix-turn-helix (wHTH) protein/tetratricopeptide (TPR) repeat protein